MSSKPNFERLRRALLLQGEPDRVPMLETSVDRDVKKAVLGRRVVTAEDEVEFWMTAGYDYAPFAVGMRLMLNTATNRAQPALMLDHAEKSTRTTSAQYAAFEDEARERAWAEEGTGIIAGSAEFESIKWPDPEAIDYTAAENLGRYLPEETKVVASIGYIIATVIRLMGFQNFCEKLIEEPDLVARVFDKVGQFQLRVFETVVAMDVVGATVQHDDVAYAGGPMVSPALLRKYLWPWYGEMCRISRDKGKPIVYHSDGNATRLLDDIVATGFHGLNPIEPKFMDIVQVKQRYGDRLALVGNIDLVYTLTRGTPEEVDAEVRQRIRDLAPGGGYALASANSITEYVPVANYNAMREAVFKYGAYPIQV